MSIGAWRTRLSLQNHKRKTPFESYFQVCFEALRLTNPLVTYCTALIEAFSTWSCRVCLFERTPYRNKRDSGNSETALLFETALPAFATSSPMMTANDTDHFPVCSTCVFDSSFYTDGALPS